MGARIARAPVGPAARARALCGDAVRHCPHMADALRRILTYRAPADLVAFGGTRGWAWRLDLGCCQDGKPRVGAGVSRESVDCQNGPERNQGFVAGSNPAAPTNPTHSNGRRRRIMIARIYKPARTAMQSGHAKTKEWVLDYEPEQPREI